MPGIRIGYLPQEPQLEPGPHGARGGRGRPGRGVRREEAPGRGLRRLRRARRGLRQARRGAGNAREDPRLGRLVHARHAARGRRRRAAPAAVGREGRQAVRRREAPRGAVPAAALRSPTCCCSTSRPTTSTPRASSGSSSSSRASPAPWWRSRTTATSSTTPPSGSSSSTAARGIPYKGNYTDWLEQKDDRLQKEESSESARQKAIKKELEWVRKNAKGQQTKNIARLKRFEELQLVRVPEAQRDRGDLHPVGRAPGQRGDRVQERLQGATATAC